MATLTLRLVKGSPLTNAEVDNNFSNINTEVSTVDGNIGILSNLTTTANSNMVVAVNEIKSNIGVISNLTTSANSNLVVAVNEVNSKVSNATITSGAISGVVITNSTWSGNTIAIAQGGTGATTAGAAATALGLGTSNAVTFSTVAATTVTANLTATTGTITTGTITTGTINNLSSGNATLTGGAMKSLVETMNVSATAATGNINISLADNNVVYYTTNASGNFTVNFRGNSTVTANTLLTTGQSITAVFLVTNGGTAYYNSAVQVDGVGVTPKWQGGTAPSAGNASSIDAYSYTLIKTGSGTYTVLGAQTRFA